MAEIGRLGQYNCRHNKYPITPEEPPLYTSDELKAKEKTEQETTEFRGKKFTPFQATQRMRALEREMRALRLEGTLHKAQYQELRRSGMKASELEDLEDPYTEARLRYRVIKSEYTALAEAFNMRPMLERVFYDGLSRVF